MSYFECQKCHGTFDPSYRYCPICDQAMVEHTEELRKFNEHKERELAALRQPPVALPPLTDAMYHAVRGLELDFSTSGPDTVTGSINDDVLDDIWEAINTALRVQT